MAFVSNIIIILIANEGQLLSAPLYLRCAVGGESCGVWHTGVGGAGLQRQLCHIQWCNAKGHWQLEIQGVGIQGVGSGSG